MRIRLRDLRQSYGGQPVLRGLELDLPESRCLGLIGPSGGGKSTTLRLLAGLELPVSGELEINGRALPRDPAGLRAYRKTVGVVFQSYNLFPHLDALANLVLPLRAAHGMSKADAEARARELLARFRLEDHAAKRPYELSGGQKQRVAIARALAHDPQLLLFDEPTSALDPEMAAEVLDAIEELIAQGKDCVVVTHQMGFARRVADHVALLADGRIAEFGPARALFDSPSTDLARAFLARVLKY